jgi:hypothetical protein
MRFTEIFPPRTVIPGIVNRADYRNVTTFPFRIIQNQPGYRIRVVSVFAQFTTGAAVANRHVVLRVLDTDGNVVAAFPSGLDQAALSTVQYTFVASTAPIGLTGVSFRTVSFGDIILYEGYSVDIHVINAQVGDSVDFIRAIFEQLDVSPYGQQVGRADDPARYMGG